MTSSGTLFKVTFLVPVQCVAIFDSQEKVRPILQLGVLPVLRCNAT